MPRGWQDGLGFVQKHLEWVRLATAYSGGIKDGALALACGCPPVSRVQPALPSELPCTNAHSAPSVSNVANL